MPLARIDLVAGKPAAYRRALGDVVYEAMLAALNVPKDDRFQLITEHPAEDLIADENYLGIRRTSDCVFIQVTLRGGRTLDQKKAFYKAVADGLHAKLNLRREDVFINLIENTKDDWSFGNGLATYAT
jgi:4-oxalocrotonate tautomerase